MCSFLLPRAKHALSTSPTLISPENKGPVLFSAWQCVALLLRRTKSVMPHGIWQRTVKRKMIRNNKVLVTLDPRMLPVFTTNLETNIHLTWVRVSAFLCPSPSFPLTLSQPSSIPCTFFTLYSLTISYYYSSTNYIIPLLFALFFSHKMCRMGLLLRWNQDCVVKGMFCDNPCFIFCTNRKLCG